jgi:hypothetical protein
VSVNVARILMIPTTAVKHFFKKILKNNVIANKCFKNRQKHQLPNPCCTHVHMRKLRHSLFLSNLGNLSVC